MERWVSNVKLDVHVADTTYRQSEWPGSVGCRQTVWGRSLQAPTAARFRKHSPVAPFLKNIGARLPRSTLIPSCRNRRPPLARGAVRLLRVTLRYTPASPVIKVRPRTTYVWTVMVRLTPGPTTGPPGKTSPKTWAASDSPSAPTPMRTRPDVSPAITALTAGLRPGTSSEPSEGLRNSQKTKFC